MINEINHQYWNILKGVAIISIVIGHTYPTIGQFVYLYHLAVFFFITGYLYKEEKYGDNPLLYVFIKIKKNWIKYSLFSCFLVLIHNVLLNSNMIIGEPYNLSMICKCILKGMLFKNNELLGAAFWFVPILVISSTMFGIMIYFSRKCGKDNIKIKNALIIVMTIISGILGIYLARGKIYLPYHSQTCFLVLPFFTSGYYLKYLFKNLNKILNIWAFIASIIILTFIIIKTDFRIELSVNEIGTRSILFYPISLIGIYFCLYLSKLINKVKYLNKYFDVIGNYSFEIMVLHLLVIKIIDIVYANINGISSYSGFPYAFPKLWPIYVILASTIPAFIFYCFDYIIKKLSKKENKGEKDIIKSNKRKTKKGIKKENEKSN